jgi:hypothetical protein
MIVSLTHRPPFTPEVDSWYSFLLEAESTPEPQCSWKDYFNLEYRPRRARIRDLPACSVVSQTTTLPLLKCNDQIWYNLTICSTTLHEDPEYILHLLRHGIASSRPALGPTHNSIQWVPGALSPGIKRLECKTNHSPPASAEVKKKNVDLYIHSPTSFYGVVLN